ncbi:mCG144635, isoform CRA_b, partial [Mus musculus]
DLDFSRYWSMFQPSGQHSTICHDGRKGSWTKDNELWTLQKRLWDSPSSVPLIWQVRVTNTRKGSTFSECSLVNIWICELGKIQVPLTAKSCCSQGFLRYFLYL